MGKARVVYLFVGMMVAIGLSSSSFAGETCGIENCHGLDITCGPAVPEMCTAMYALGDRCRQYAQCAVIDGKCQLVKNPQFEACKACIKKCLSETSSDPIKAMNCESQCGL